MVKEIIKSKRLKVPLKKKKIDLGGEKKKWTPVQNHFKPLAFTQTVATYDDTKKESNNRMKKTPLG